MREKEAEVERMRAGMADASPVAAQAAQAAPIMGELLDQWVASLTNRSAYDDRCRVAKHVRSVFSDMRISDITLPVVMRWIDRQRAAGKLADPTIRHNLNLLSRFFSWAIERGYTQANPVRQIQVGKRPRLSRKQEVAWLDDDAIVRKLLAEEPEPINLMFYLGNRSGLRMGEAAGLRMSDLGFLAEGVIRVRYSYTGPLKEDKEGLGKAKWVPAPADATAYLGPWMTRRRAEGADPEDLLFPRKGRRHRKEHIEGRWERAAGKVGVELTWYQATRHSFVSRILSKGGSLDEVSTAVEHSSPGVTRRYYDHFVRRSYSDTLREGLGLTGATGEGGERVSLRQIPPTPTEWTTYGPQTEHDHLGTKQKGPEP